MMLFDGRPAVAMDLLLLQGEGRPTRTSCCERDGRPAAREGAAGWRRQRLGDARMEGGVTRDGNGYIPVGYWPPISVPARTKFYPSGYPYAHTGSKTLLYPYPTGNSYAKLYPKIIYKY